MFTSHSPASSVIWQHQSRNDFRGVMLDDRSDTPDKTGETLITYYNSTEKVNALMDHIFGAADAVIVDGLGTAPQLCAVISPPGSQRWANVQGFSGIRDASMQAGIKRWYCWDGQWSVAGPEGYSYLR